ncbi:uncharacterized protein LOC116342329 [Contarinia nasturtii]|uniref:uncharacterized protein LOC116342329 n=1 Tax=Contarinia nasturtii TaxID=265458 RepID=UPI0012D3A2BF|nr:uncharacterized protein LOC116342329 [Contarinia nasturtii]
MGKIKRERQKFHISADNKGTAKAEKKETSKSKHLPLKLDAVENIFAGITIKLDSINKFEEKPEPTTELVNSKEEEAGTVEQNDTEVAAKQLLQIEKTKTVPEKHLTKKEKMALKHQKLMEKLDVTQKARMQSQKNKKQKRNANPDTLLASQSEVRSLLTPAAVKPHTEKIPKNIFSVPSLKDDLPGLNSIFELKKNHNSNKTSGLTSKSKAISKTSNKSFVKNYNFLKKAMAKKKIKK